MEAAELCSVKEVRELTSRRILSPAIFVMKPQMIWGHESPLTQVAQELGLRFPHSWLLGLLPSYTLAVRDARFPGNTPPRDRTQQLLFISYKALVTQPFPAGTS